MPYLRERPGLAFGLFDAFGWTSLTLDAFGSFGTFGAFSLFLAVDLRLRDFSTTCFTLRLFFMTLAFAIRFFFDFLVKLDEEVEFSLALIDALLLRALVSSLCTGAVPL